MGSLFCTEGGFKEGGEGGQRRMLGSEEKMRRKKAGAIPLLKHDSSGAGRELGGGWRGINVRERKLIICWLRSRMPSVCLF